MWALADHAIARGCGGEPRRVVVDGLCSRIATLFKLVSCCGRTVWQPLSFSGGLTVACCRIELAAVGQLLLEGWKRRFSGEVQSP